MCSRAYLNLRSQASAVASGSPSHAEYVTEVLGHGFSNLQPDQILGAAQLDEIADRPGEAVGEPDAVGRAAYGRRLNQNGNATDFWRCRVAAPWQGTGVAGLAAIVLF